MWIVIVIAVVFLLAFLVRKRWNNCVLIARNTTYIYEILSTDFKDQFPNEGILLATSGVIDALKYVMEGSLPVDEIVTGSLSSEFGKCYLDFMKFDMSDNPTREFFIHDTPRILYFIMQLEALIFHVDTNVPPEYILSAVKSEKRVIKKEIKKTKYKYKAQGAPPLLKENTYSFMNCEAFAGLRDELGIIRPIPEQQLDELFQELIKRKHWKDIDPDIIKSIFNNAKGDVGAIKTFISISELHNSVGNNFIKLASGTSKEFVLKMFATTLYRLGSELLKAAISAIKDKDGEKIEHCAIPADMAFTSSILCEPCYLESYVGMALLYGYVWINKDAALEFCRKYKEVEYKLLNTPDEELSASELIAKENLDPEKLKSTLKEMAEHTTGLLPDGWEEEVTKSMSDTINELEAELLQA